MLSAATQSQLLALHPMLAALPASEREALLAGAHHLKLPAGSVVFDENQPCQGFPLLLSGVVRVIKAAPNGRELLLYRVCPGESCILTSSCLLGHAHYSARGVVEQAVEIIALPAPVFRQLIATHEPFRAYIFNLFSERITELMELVSAVTFQKLDQRLAALLLTKRSPIHATHQQLADELGSVREMVSRLLKQFADHGWVRLGREQIELLNLAELAKVSAP